MGLFFGKVLFHRQVLNNGEFSDDDKNEMLNELEEVLNKYGAELARHETVNLNKENHPVSECSRCKYLTLDISNTKGELERGEVYDDLYDVLHLGHVKDGKLICTACKEWV